MTNLTNTTHAHIDNRCPQCGVKVGNVATSANFGAYVPMPSKGKGSRSKPPVANWVFYETDSELCKGDGFRHYYQMIKGRRVGFLWLLATDIDVGSKLSTDCRELEPSGQMALL